MSRINICIERGAERADTRIVRIHFSISAALPVQRSCWTWLLLIFEMKDEMYILQNKFEDVPVHRRAYILSTGMCHVRNLATRRKDKENAVADLRLLTFWRLPAKASMHESRAHPQTQIQQRINRIYVLWLRFIRPDCVQFAAREWIDDSSRRKSEQL